MIQDWKLDIPTRTWTYLRTELGTGRVFPAPPPDGGYWWVEFDGKHIGNCLLCEDALRVVEQHAEAKRIEAEIEALGEL